MNTDQSAILNSKISLSSAALVAGLGLLLMAILAPIANFGILEKLPVSGDPALALNQFMVSAGQIRLAVLLFLLVAVLDVLVAWGLYVLLEPVNKHLSLLAAWFRVAYAIMLAVALGNLLNLLQHLSQSIPGVMEQGQRFAQVSFDLKAFTSQWEFGLIVFGLHLLLVGYLVFKSDYMPTWLGVLLSIAGLGYAVDGVGKVASASYVFSLSAYTFVGEVILIFWLIWWAAKRRFKPAS